METKIISVERKPFTSDYRKDCGWHLIITFTLGDVVYKRRLQQNNDISCRYDNGVFIFSQCVTETPTTLGALKELENIRDGIISSTYISPVERYIVHAIQTLDLYWD